MENQVLTRSANGVGRLTFNRPEQRNATAETKRLMRLSRHNTFASQFDAEIEGAASCVSDEDFMEAVTAFSERRQAKFGRRP
jgi:enoyl-CoA hydratase/carnithine racemase